MVGAGCPTKVSTQQPSAHSAWAPARPSPASSVISQKPALTNVPSSEPATRKICHPAKTLPSTLKKKKSCTKVALPFWSDGIHRWDLLHWINSAPAHCFWIHTMNTVPPESAELDRREESHLSQPLTPSWTGIIYWCWAVNVQALMVSVAPRARMTACA